MKERICIVCKKTLTVHHYGPDGGVAFVGDPGYGSGFDTVLQEQDDSWPEMAPWKIDEEYGGNDRKLSIVICDPCLSVDEGAVVVEHTFVVHRVTESTTPWSACDAPKQWREHQATKRKEQKP